MKYLIAGLGNPGEEYANTRHNVGFLVLDAFAKASGTSFSPGRHGDIAEAKFKGRQLILLKPNTFMNLSGKAVNYWLQQEKIPIDRLLVISDDIALPFGQIRLRKKGSDGGHNGLKNITYLLNSNKFARLRFGVGNDFFPGQQIQYVLGQWNDEEAQSLPERLEMAGKVIESFCTIGPDRTMSAFNNK